MSSRFSFQKFAANLGLRSGHRLIGPYGTEVFLEIKDNYYSVICPKYQHLSIKGGQPTALGAHIKEQHGITLSARGGRRKHAPCDGPAEFLIRHNNGDYYCLRDSIWSTLRFDPASDSFVARS
jgi:hypothetical protein